MSINMNCVGLKEYKDRTFMSEKNFTELNLKQFLLRIKMPALYSKR